ncbi:hypothetical protein [Devosia naphthalenivorans]|uniref:hypothetical protein n=1 Tax=Devosia naphthalenivorans TaxID=2082392 RepID=UPI0013B06A23|nr:hypothetical protein [Devosia naphthalenivorans]
MADVVTGNYDLHAIDLYVDRRNPDLIAPNSQSEAETDNDLFMARIAAIGRTSPRT